MSVRCDVPQIPLLCSPVSWAILGRTAAGERGDSLSEVVLGMVAIGAPDNVLGGPKDTGDVVYRHPQLQEHGCAGVPQDVGGHFWT
jgi:hypothetical protein